MAETPLSYVEANKFPRDVRESLNDVVDRLNTQQWEVKFTEDLSPQSAKVEMSDERCVILIPRGGLLGASLRGGFGLVTQTRPKNGGGVNYQWAIVPGLLKNTQKNIGDGGPEYIPVTGTVTVPDSGIISPTDSAWTNIASGGTPTNPVRLWIEIAAETWPSVDSAYVNDAPWGGGELEYAPNSNSPPDNIQTFARFVVGQVTSYTANGAPKIVAFPGCSQLQLFNGGDTAFDSAKTNGASCPIWFPSVT